MAGAGEYGKGISDQRGKPGDALGVTAQQLFGYVDEEIHPSRRLQATSCSDDGDNHQHDVDRSCCRFKPENKGQDGEPEPAHHAEADAAKACTNQDGGKDDGKFDQ
ncbi:hypothetical protein JHS3_11070 [Jeongeupia sp. HS-3]|nr:hypothetical protein JHS3_11070 [Jeongeupia sp. HS-3]